MDYSWWMWTVTGHYTPPAHHSIFWTQLTQLHRPNLEEQSRHLPLQSNQMLSGMDGKRNCLRLFSAS